MTVDDLKKAAIALVFVSFPIPARSDVFTTDGASHQLTSIFKTQEYLRDSNISTGFSTRLKRDSQTAGAINTLAGNDVSLSNSSSPLLLLEYSAPAEADVYKHYQTIAFLRYGQDMERLRDLERDDHQDIELLRKRSILDCLRTATGTDNITGDIGKMIDDCSEGAPFAKLQQVTGASNVFDVVLTRPVLDPDHRKELLSIMPRWNITAKGVYYYDAAKRAGKIFFEKESANLGQIQQLLEKYGKRNVSENDVMSQLQVLGVPGAAASTVELNHLLALDSRQQQKAVEQLAQELAYRQTMALYDEAIDMLLRSSNNPNWGDAYGNLMRKAEQYLRNEKESLSVALSAKKSYVNSLKDVEEQGVEQERRAYQHDENNAKFRMISGL